jgi:hypothetical protein
MSGSTPAERFGVSRSEHVAFGQRRIQESPCSVRIPRLVG